MTVIIMIVHTEYFFNKKIQIDYEMVIIFYIYISKCIEYPDSPSYVRKKGDRNSNPLSISR